MITQHGQIKGVHSFDAQAKLGRGTKVLGPHSNYALGQTQVLGADMTWNWYIFYSFGQQSVPVHRLFPTAMSIIFRMMDSGQVLVRSTGKIQ